MHRAYLGCSRFHSGLTVPLHELIHYSICLLGSTLRLTLSYELDKQSFELFPALVGSLYFPSSPSVRGEGPLFSSAPFFLTAMADFFQRSPGIDA